MASILQIGQRWRAQVRPKGGKGAARTFQTEAEARAWAESVEACYEVKRPIVAGWRDITHSALQRTRIASTTGIYFLYLQGSCVYVGQSVNVFSRIENHFREKAFDEWAWVSVPMDELCAAEQHFIRTLKPALNVTYNRKPRGMDLSTAPLEAS